MIHRCNYKFQVMSKVSGPISQVFTSSLQCQVYSVKSTYKYKFFQAKSVYGVKSSSATPANEI